MARLQISDRDYIDTGEPVLPTKGLGWPPNDLAVRFVNTAEPREETSRVHRRGNLGLVTQPLVGYDDIVRWMGRMKGLADAEVRALLQVSDVYPPDAIEIAVRMTDLRVLLGRMVNAWADRKRPAMDDRRQLRDLVNELWPPLTYELDLEGDGGIWTLAPSELSLEHPLRQLVLSMARLTASRTRRRICRCQREGCGLLYVHNTRGPRPAFCHKGICGEKSRKRPSQAWR